MDRCNNPRSPLRHIPIPPQHHCPQSHIRSHAHFLAPPPVIQTALLGLCPTSCLQHPENSCSFLPSTAPPLLPCFPHAASTLATRLVHVRLDDSAFLFRTAIAELYRTKGPCICTQIVFALHVRCGATCDFGRYEQSKTPGGCKISKLRWVGDSMLRWP
jgi:hypothetical protein